MIQCQEVQTWIDQNSDNGVYQTEDVRLHLESCGKCREYRQQLEMLVNTLDRIVIPDPPEGLVDDVMLFLEEHEPEMIEFPEYDWGELLRETWQAFLNLLPQVEIPQVVRQEAVPITLAVVAFVWGGLIAPRVEAGKAEEWLKHPIVQEIDSYALQLRERSEKTADKVYSFTNQMITRAYKQILDQSPSQKRLEKVKPFNGTGAALSWSLGESGHLQLVWGEIQVTSELWRKAGRWWFSRKRKWYETERPMVAGISAIFLAGQFYNEQNKGIMILILLISFVSIADETGVYTIPYPLV